MRRLKMGGAGLVQSASERVAKTLPPSNNVSPTLRSSFIGAWESQ